MNYETFRDSIECLKIILRQQTLACKNGDTNTVFESHAMINSVIKVVDLAFEKVRWDLEEYDAENIDYELTSIANESDKLIAMYKQAIA